MGPRVTDAELRAGVAAGRTDAELAELHNVTEMAVRKHRHRLGLMRRRAGAPFDLEVLRGLHQEGHPNRDIAERMGSTLRTVQQKLYELGLKAHRAPPAAVSISEAAPRGRGRPTIGEARRDHRLVVHLSSAELADLDARLEPGEARAEGMRRLALGR